MTRATKNVATCDVYSGCSARFLKDKDVYRVMCLEMEMKFFDERPTRYTILRMECGFTRIDCAVCATASIYIYIYRNIEIRSEPIKRLTYLIYKSKANIN